MVFYTASQESTQKPSQTRTNAAQTANIVIYNIKKNNYNNNYVCVITVFKHMQVKQ